MALRKIPVSGSKARDGLYGPQAGALSVIPVQFTAGVASKTYEHRLTNPTGMKYEIVAAEVISLGLAGTPSLAIGDSTASSAYTAPLVVTTANQVLTLKKNAATGEIRVAVTTAAAETFDSVSVNLFVYVTSPPDSLAIRNIKHY